MFSTSSAVHVNFNPTIPHSRLGRFLQQRSHTSFDTYPPKKNGLYTLMQKKALSSHSLEQTKTPAAMTIRNSPVRATNTGRFYTKRTTTARRSFSESSAEKQLHKKYTSSDSSQEDEELMMSVSAAEKRKMTRRSFSNGLQQTHKYRSLQSVGNVAEEDIAGCRLFGKRSQHISDMIDIAIRVVLMVVFRQVTRLLN